MTWLKEAHLHGFSDLAKRVATLQETRFPAPGVECGRLGIRRRSRRESFGRLARGKSERYTALGGRSVSDKGRSIGAASH